MRTTSGLDLGMLVVNRLRGRADEAPLLDPGVPPLIPSVEMSKNERATEARNLAMLEPSTRAFAKSVAIWARANGMRTMVGETYRSLAAQMALPEGRTAIETGKIGWHQVGRAFHLVVRTPGGSIDRDAYPVVGRYVESRGGTWLGKKPLMTPSGPVDDFAHFEYHPGLKLSSYRGSALAAKEIAAAEKRAAKYGYA
jgi:hypothetical protein